MTNRDIANLVNPSQLSTVIAEHISRQAVYPEHLDGYLVSNVTSKVRDCGLAYAALAQ